jgi:acyl-CoA synthetase (AMP-forming)/AMP-acid ligase II
MGGALDLDRASGAHVALRLPAGNLVASTETGAAMILGDSAAAAAAPPHARNRVTIDEVFRRLAERRPAALALADTPNRETFTDAAPRRLTFAEADRMVSAIAGRLRDMGLPTDAIVGLQLPNIVENILTMLGVLRAGMIVAPLPLLWRRADAVAALTRIGAKALITCGHVGAFDHSGLALRVAAEVFSIRYVCGFGSNLPDGVVPFDDLFTTEKLDPIPPLDRERQSNAARHVAAVTFDVSEGGIVPVARNHPELLAAGLAVLLESRLPQHASILSAFAPSSFAGISLTLLPWLLSGGTLVLHHAFDPDIFAGQRQDERCGALILPAPVVFSLAEAGAFSGGSPACVIAAWRSPDRLALSPVWHEPSAVLVDVPIFGEAALVPSRRGAAGTPNAVRLGPVMAARNGMCGLAVAKLLRTDAGTLAVRGPMVPHHSFPPGIERSGLPYFKVGRWGVVETGYACRIDSGSNTMVLSDAPAEIASVGGYRFPLRALQDAVARIDSGATLTAQPDPLLGRRLIGDAAARDTMRAALDAAGVNPIVAAAFGDRGAPAGAT